MTLRAYWDFICARDCRRAFRLAGPALLTDRATFDMNVFPRLAFPPDRIRPIRGSKGFSLRFFTTFNPGDLGRMIVK